MKKTILMLSLSVLSLSSMAKTFTCTSADKKVNVVAVLTSETSGTVEVLTPFQKQMNCAVSDFAIGVDVVKGFVCGDGLPDIFAVNEKSSKGMIEVSNHPHYDLNCEIH